MSENNEVKTESLRLDFATLITQFAGAFKGLNAKMEQRARSGLPVNSSCVMWMIDEEGAHLIDTEVLLEAMDKFLTEIEEKDYVMKLEKKVDDGKTETGPGEGQADQTENS